ncbi:MAG: protease complex subunit PrcB family protein [Spirochaetes bacterium]|nr:protease complex subunit PrcB family protein [Spirochaetota bacterium]
MKTKLFVAAVLILCMATPALLLARKKSDGEQVQYGIAEEGTQMEYQIKKADIVVIQDETKFRDFHSRIHRTRVPKPSTPQVDFNSHFVVFLTYGEQPSAGYFIQVRTVVKRENTVVVRTLLKEPSQDSYQAQALTHPYVFVEIPRENFQRVEWASVVGEVFYSKPLQ